MEIVENQKESVIGRKTLADKTKGKHGLVAHSMSGSALYVDFRKIPDEEKLNEFRGLLKCKHAAFMLG